MSNHADAFMIKNILANMEERHNYKENDLPQADNRAATPMDKEDVHDRSRDKPKYSYNSLIIMAISHHPRKMISLNDIYEFIAEKFPFYKNNKQDWKNSIRHNLSISKYFQKIPRPFNEPGKGHYWALTSEGQRVVIGEDTGKLRKVAHEFQQSSQLPQPMYFQYQPQSGFCGNQNYNYNLRSMAHVSVPMHHHQHHDSGYYLRQPLQTSNHEFYSVPYHHHHHHQKLYPAGHHPYC